jgi:hypothetical protein
VRLLDGPDCGDTRARVHAHPNLESHVGFVLDLKCCAFGKNV